MSRSSTLPHEEKRGTKVKNDNRGNESEKAVKIVSVSVIIRRCVSVIIRKLYLSFILVIVFSIWGSSWKSSVELDKISSHYILIYNVAYIHVGQLL